MPRCTGTIGRQQCRREVEEGQTQCNRCQERLEHREQLAGPIREGGCSRIKTNGGRCDRLAEANTTLCRTHRTLDERWEAQRRTENAFQEQLRLRVDAIEANKDTIAWHDALQMVHLDFRGANISHRLFQVIVTRFTFIYENYPNIAHFNRFHTALTRSDTLPMEMEEAQRNEFLERNLHLPPPPPVGELGVLAGDRQNVHTRFVSSQTNEGMEKLLKMQIPPDQHTRKSIARAWMAIYALKDNYWKIYLDVLNDMNVWYETESCRDPGDRLYRRVLDGAWALIQTSAGEVKLQLIKRLYEESRDSYQMCSEGHISRIINVFSGFDESFKGTADIGEKIQEAMAELSRKEMPLEQKITLAKNLFNTLSIPTFDQAPWLEALAQ
jgi:hypothetical protein